MEEPLKRRLVGATVIMSLVVIFVPMLVDDEPISPVLEPASRIPTQPTLMTRQQKFQREQPVSAGSIDEAGDTTPLAQVPPSKTQQGSLENKPPAAAPEVAVKPALVQAEPPATPKLSEKTPDIEEENAVHEERRALKAWVVQVASFTNPKFAKSLVSDLQEKGFAAFMEDVFSGGRIWYRVVVGPEVDKQRTRDLQEAIVEATGDDRLRGAIKVYP